MTSGDAKFGKRGLILSAGEYECDDNGENCALKYQDEVESNIAFADWRAKRKVKNRRPVLGKAAPWMKAECAMDTKIDILDFSEFVVCHDCPLYSDDDIQNFEEWKARHGRNSMSIGGILQVPICYKGVKANAPTHYTHDDRTDPPSRMKNRVMITANASPSCKHRITADSEMKGYIRRTVVRRGPSQEKR